MISSIVIARHLGGETSNAEDLAHVRTRRNEQETTQLPRLFETRISSDRVRTSLDSFSGTRGLTGGGSSGSVTVQFFEKPEE